jgi:hypothetical protein
MKRLTPQIALLISVCLLGINFAGGAVFAAAPYPPTMCCSGSIHMGHCNDMINFMAPMQKCCDQCNNLFCGPINDPLQDVNPVHPSPEQGYYYSFHPENLNVSDLSFVQVVQSKPGDSTPNELASNLIPLCIEHLSLLI